MAVAAVPAAGARSGQVPGGGTTILIEQYIDRALGFADRGMVMRRGRSVSNRKFSFAAPNASCDQEVEMEATARDGLAFREGRCAQLYDGFTIIVFQWLEALGFCGVGESGPFVEAGHTRLGGRIPVNTDGGACNVGRRHGANFCIESIRQLRGECGDRQVPGAEVAVWSNAVGPFSGAMLMTAS